MQLYQITALTLLGWRTDTPLVRLSAPAACNYVSMYTQLLYLCMYYVNMILEQQMDTL